MAREMVTGAAHWASYLINGDSSGMRAHEIAECESWRERNNIKHVLTCGEERFTWYYALHCGGDLSGGNVVEYAVETKT